MSSIAESKGLVAEQVGRDRLPWSTGRYCEKPDPGPPSDRTCAGKSLILRDAREQIPYATEQGNKSDEQGDKIDDQGIKSAEHGKARQVSSGRLWRRAGRPPPLDARRARSGARASLPAPLGTGLTTLKIVGHEGLYAARCARACADQLPPRRERRTRSRGGAAATSWRSLTAVRVEHGRSS